MKTRIPLNHLSHSVPKYSIIRRNFKGFRLPPVKGMREPGSASFSIQTAEGQAWLDLSK